LNEIKIGVSISFNKIKIGVLILLINIFYKNFTYNT